MGLNPGPIEESEGFPYVCKEIICNDILIKGLNYSSGVTRDEHQRDAENTQEWINDISINFNGVNLLE